MACYINIIEECGNPGIGNISIYETDDNICKQIQNTFYYDANAREYIGCVKINCAVGAKLAQITSGNNCVRLKITTSAPDFSLIQCKAFSYTFSPFTGTSCANCSCKSGSPSTSVSVVTLESCTNSNITLQYLLPDNSNISIDDIIQISNCIDCFKVRYITTTTNPPTDKYLTLLATYGTCQECVRTFTKQEYQKEHIYNWYYPVIKKECDDSIINNTIGRMIKTYKRKSLLDRFKIGYNNIRNTIKDYFISSIQYMILDYELKEKDDCCKLETCCAPCIIGFNETLYLECNMRISLTSINERICSMTPIITINEQ